MFWTRERLAALRDVASLGGYEAARRLGVTIGSVNGAADRQGIKIGVPRAAHGATAAEQAAMDVATRKRWAARLPEMRERVRAAVLASAG